MTLVFSLSLNLLFSAGGLFAQDLKVGSVPEKADIFIQDLGSETERTIGKTPFKEKLQTFLGTYVKKNSFILIIKKDGYEPYRMLFTKNKNVDINIEVNLEVDKKISTIKKHDLLVSELFKVQKMIRSRDFAGAVKRLEVLEGDYQHFSIIPELKATAHYLNKDIERALAMYREAFSLNSKNVDAYKMKTYLEKKLGVSVQ